MILPFIIVFSAVWPCSARFTDAVAVPQFGRMLLGIPADLHPLAFQRQLLAPRLEFEFDRPGKPLIEWRAAGGGRKRHLRLSNRVVL